ncbi:uncharacterized protein VTP21DRAFT_5954 [Calcarisporiella thermophila]|uniref:uncharacterized protein n=1 Tax=Calcarisporiella thermophila TaxID=911321 RepID=UPI0037436487
MTTIEPQQVDPTAADAATVLDQQVRRVFGNAKRIWMSELLKLVEQDEAEQGFSVFDEGTKNTIREFARQYPTFDVSADELIPNLVALLQSQQSQTQEQQQQQSEAVEERTKESTPEPKEYSSEDQDREEKLSNEKDQPALAEFAGRRRTTPVLKIATPSRRSRRRAGGRSGSVSSAGGYESDRAGSPDTLGRSTDYFARSTDSPTRQQRVESPSLPWPDPSLNGNPEFGPDEGLITMNEFFHPDLPPGTTVEQLLEENKELHQKQRQAEEMEKQLHQREEEIQRLRREQRDLNGQFLSLKRENNELLNREKKRASEISQLQEELSKAVKTANDNKRSSEQNMRLYDSKSEEVGKLQQVMRQKEQHQQALQNSINELEDEKRRLTIEKDRFESAARDLRHELLSVELERDNVNNDLQRMEEAYQELKKRYEEARLERSSAGVVSKRPEAVKTLHSELLDLGLREPNDPLKRSWSRNSQTDRVKSLEEKVEYYKQEADKARSKSLSVQEQYQTYRATMESGKQQLREQIQTLELELHRQKEANLVLSSATGPSMSEVGVQHVPVMQDRDVQTQTTTHTISVQCEPLLRAEASVQCALGGSSLEGDREIRIRQQVLASELSVQAALVEGLLKTHRERSKKKAESLAGQQEAARNTLGTSHAAPLPSAITTKPPLASVQSLRNDFFGSVTVIAIVVYLLGVISSKWMQSHPDPDFPLPGWAGGFASVHSRSGMMEMFVYWWETLLWSGDSAGLPT